VGDVVYDLQAREDPPMIREDSLPLNISCYDVVGVIATRAIPSPNKGFFLGRKDKREWASDEL
jgi:hypothetical protein